MPNTPEGWRPTEGSTLTGPISGFDLGWSDQKGKSYPIVIVADQSQNGKLIAVHAFHSVLVRRLKQLRPEAGEVITIVYHGQQPSKDGQRTISLYSASIEGREAAMDWDSIDAS